MTALPDRGFAKVVRIVSTPTAPKNDSVMKIATPFDDSDDSKSYKWSEIRDALELGSNVANARWMPEKIMPLFANLDAPKLLTEQGRPTKFCAQMVSRYKSFVIDSGNDYEVFSAQVRSQFVDDAPKAVTPEVLDADDSDDAPSSLALMERQVEEQDDSIEDKIMLAIIAKQRADSAMQRYEGANKKSWEQEIVEDELQKYQQEQERKAAELEIRLKVRQMLDAQSLGKPDAPTSQP